MDKPQVLYVYDPLCGWCYGFSPVMQQLKKKYSDQVTWSIYSGGLAIGDRAIPIKEKFKYIQGALETVTQATGVEFGAAFRQLMEEGTYAYNSEPPCKALTVVKMLQGKDPLAFAHDLHHVFFYEGKSLNDLETYLPLVDKQEIARDTFIQSFNTDSARRKTYEEFAFVQQLGISGFPALALVQGDQGYLLARGYQRYDPLSEVINQLLYENKSS